MLLLYLFVYINIEATTTTSTTTTATTTMTTTTTTTEVPLSAEESTSSKTSSTSNATPDQKSTPYSTGDCLNILPIHGVTEKKLENVAMATALQLEVARRHASPFPF